MGPACSRILPLEGDGPSLFLGSIDFMVDPTLLTHVNAGAIVSVLPEVPDGISTVLADSGIDQASDYMLLPLDDMSDHYRGLLDDAFWRTLEFIYSRRKAGKNVLVHCDAGLSRSAVIVVAYLMAYGTELGAPKCMSYSNALRVVQERRERVATEMFDTDLRRLETHLGVQRNTSNNGEQFQASGEHLISATHTVSPRPIDLCSAPGAAIAVCSSVLCCPVRADTKLVGQLAGKSAHLRLPLVHGATVVA